MPFSQTPKRHKITTSTITPPPPKKKNTHTQLQHYHTPHNMSVNNLVQFCEKLNIKNITKADMTGYCTH